MCRGRAARAARIATASEAQQPQRPNPAKPPWCSPGPVGPRFPIDRISVQWTLRGLQIGGGAWVCTCVCWLGTPLHTFGCNWPGTGANSGWICHWPVTKLIWSDPLPPSVPPLNSASAVVGGRCRGRVRLPTPPSTIGRNFQEFPALRGLSVFAPKSSPLGRPLEACLGAARGSKPQRTLVRASRRAGGES